jgi:TRAP-type transport system small permease protein
MHSAAKDESHPDQPHDKPGWFGWPYVDDAINAALLGGIVVALAIQVFARYILNYSMGWSSEVAGILMSWLMFLGAPAMLRRQSHMAIYLYGSLQPLAQRIIRILIELTCGVFYLVVLFGSIDLMAASAMFTTPALGLPGNYVAAVVPVASTYLIIRTLIRVFDLMRSQRPVWLEQEET